MSHYSQSQKPRTPTDNKNIIIFDFDGVLADTFELFYLLIRDSMEKIGIPLSKSGYRELFKDNVHAGFKKLIANTKRYESFRTIRKKNYNKYYKKYKPRLFEGVKELLEELSGNYTLAIASSGKKHNIVGLLKKGGVYKHFNLILATEDHTKADMIKEIIKKHKADPKKTTMITDTAGDVKIAKKLGLKTVAVTWGFHAKKLLISTNPDFVASNFKELISKTFN